MTKHLDPPYSEAAIESAARQFVQRRGFLTWELAVAICWQLLTYIDVDKAFAPPPPPPARPVLRAIEGGRRRSRAKRPALTLIQGGRKTRRRTRRMDAPPL